MGSTYDRCLIDFSLIAYSLYLYNYIQLPQITLKSSLYILDKTIIQTIFYNTGKFGISSGQFFVTLPPKIN